MAKFQKPEPGLIAACKRGDRAAMGELFERHYPSSLRLARGILRNEAESEDSVQAAYLSALRHLHCFREDASFKTWITRIVVNCCLMQIRDRRRQLTWANLGDVERTDVVSILAARAPTPEETASGREIASAYSRALAKLPRRLREAYSLRHVSGLTLKQIAAELGLTVPAVKTRLFRAQARMRWFLQPVRATRREAA
ncbi:MAG: sigma-70 family RNA polymerase sigma factor [Bryobacteraceae bacterium]